ncbi:PopZ family protein [Bosea thiooxidans]
MSAQAKASEPSMEEILASIRRIISDDDAKPAEAEAPAADAAAEAPAPTPTPAAEPEPAPPAAIDEDVLDLGAEAALIAAPPPETPAPQPAAPPAEEPDITFVEEASAAPAPPAEPAPPPPAAVFIPSTTSAPAVDMASLLSDQASSAVTNAFGHLANTVLSNNARTLEDLVKEMLKPMLKAWLDDNLPTMVERLVRAEIERVARGGRS